ncbi:MAG: hypothetical protein EKK29_09680 [Hyphomicrobiales bacterium]|nr:MAG: hypothetical protein EKK29_09680 [Hyphomicrobiales bacterium]
MSVAQTKGRVPFLALAVRRLRQDLQFSRIFLVDLAATSAYAAATLLLLHLSAPTPQGARAVLVAGAVYGLMLALKLGLVVYLEKRGGDARQFVGSETLVTSGVYAFSRNPVYVVSLLQSLAWSLGLIGVCLTSEAPCALTLLMTAAALLYGHYWGMDRLIVPNEEAALRARHPDEFANYCARVNRWLGRRAQPVRTSR